MTQPTEMEDRVARAIAVADGVPSDYMSKLGAMGGLRRGRRKVRGDSEYYRNLGAANNKTMEAARAARAKKKIERDKAKEKKP